MDLPLIPVILYQFVICLAIICIQTFFFYKTLGLSKKWRGLRLVFVVMIFAIVETTLQLIVLNFLILSWVFVLILVCFIAYPVIFMAGKLKERILYAVLSCTTYLISLLLGTIAMFYQVVNAVGTSWLSIVMFPVIVIAANGILVLVIIHLSTEGKRYLPRQYWAGAMISFLVISVGLSVVDYLNAWMTDADKLYQYMCYFTMAFLVLWLLAYFVFYILCRYFTKVNEANVLLVQNDMIERYLLRRQASDERIRILSHDLKHSLIQWRKLAEEKGDVDALQNILEYEGQLKDAMLINVENENANAIINQKVMEAKEEQITFLTEGAFHKDLLISKLDLCSLLGNLLDNAIEAAIQADHIDLRQVKLSISRKGNLLILVVENGYTLSPVVEYGKFVTQKKDKELHAIGMRSIGYVAQKYDGVYSNSYTDNLFKATVMLKGYQAVLSDKN